MRSTLITFFILLNIVGNAQLTEENPLKNIIKIKGEFVSSQKPENLIVILKVTEGASSYQKCFTKAFDTRKKMVEAFESNGIEMKSVKTRDLSIQEQYGWENQKEKARYVAYINMQIEEKYTDEFADKLLKSLQSYSFQVNYSIRFILSDDQKKMLRQKAIEEAVADATEKARIISKAANIELGEINRISYGDNWNSGYGNRIDDDIILDMEYDMAVPITRQGSFSDSGIDFNPKDISIKKVVFIEWNIKKNN